MWALQGTKKAYNGAVCEWWRQVKRSLKKTSSSLERRRFWEWWPSSRCHSIKVCSCLHNPPHSTRQFEHCNVWTGAIVGEDTWMSHHKSPRTEFTFIWRVILWRITNTDSSIRFFWKPHIYSLRVKSLQKYPKGCKKGISHVLEKYPSPIRIKKSSNDCYVAGRAKWCYIRHISRK